MEKQETAQKKRLVLIMVIYLFGLFLGALSTGIITPARTIIQSGLGVDDQTGIWMITIFTLCYAAIIPIAGKLADRHGRKIVYIVSITLFGVGSVICGLSAGMNSFAVLIVGRIVQAIGAGGIMPIATAEFGTSFPEEKRGMALGMVGAVYGIANVLGATAGSAILDLFGIDQWYWIFYINVPFCLLIVLGSLFFIPNHRSEIKSPIDKTGTLVMTIIILALLYGLKNIDFFDFLPSLLQTDVYPFLLAALVLMPVFYLIEKRARDPIFHMEYLHNRQIAITLLLSLLAGASMMGMIFIPQFAENALRIQTGSGGYFVIILGFCAGAASPISGGLIDKFGAKPILAMGFAVTVIGCAYLSFVAVRFVNLGNVIVSLILIGLGMGLTMGTPLNYMMMRNTSDEESNSALATLSLVRSIGTAIAPAIMVGFLVQAGAVLQDDLMEAMPPLPETPVLVQQERLDEIVAELQELNKDSDDEELQAMLASMDDMEMDSTAMDMEALDGDMELPDDILKQLQTADVTNIVERSKSMAAWMFAENTPPVIADIEAGIGEGIAGIDEGIDGISEGIAEMESAVAEMAAAKAELQQGIDGVGQGIGGMQTGLAKQDQAIAALEQMIALGSAGGTMPPAMADAPEEGGTEPAPEEGEAEPEPTPEPTPEPAPTPEMPDIAALEQQLAALQAARDQLAGKLATAQSQRAQMQSAYREIGSGQAELAGAIADMKYQRGLMQEAEGLMQDMQAAVPQLFAVMEAEYMAAIDADSAAIEQTFQSTLNGGFRDMYICVAAFNLLGLLLLALYRDDRRPKKEAPAA